MGNWDYVRHVAEDRLIDTLRDALRQRRHQAATAARTISQLYWADGQEAGP